MKAATLAAFEPLARIGPEAVLEQMRPVPGLVHTPDREPPPPPTPAGRGTHGCSWLASNRLFLQQLGLESSDENQNQKHRWVGGAGAYTASKKHVIMAAAPASFETYRLHMGNNCRPPAFVWQVREEEEGNEE
ncbi:hypothetical protein EYF80_054676 [Liparis tanakae]|uniref:Uncharacterized protein n=1 Tax=Liparis tanakae TaxID=230148 RepID=A0A4Z2F3A9_9TELE|nr:hypothetical protein EYF80_054676 [Liparis tanakae]